MSEGASTGTHLRTTSFQPSSLRWPLLGLVRLGLLLGEHPGRAMALSWADSMLGGRSLSMSWSLGEAECQKHTHTHIPFESFAFTPFSVLLNSALYVLLLLVWLGDVDQGLVVTETVQRGALPLLRYGGLLQRLRGGGRGGRGGRG